MKRDMDLMRAILLAFENKTSGDIADLSIDGFASELVMAHTVLLIEAGYLKGTILLPIGGPPMAFVERLTWEGHDLIDSIRSETVWVKTKDTMLSKLGTLSFELVKAVATQIAKQQLGLPHA